MKKEDIYLDLRKLTDEQREKAFSLLLASECRGDYNIYGSCYLLKTKTYPRVMEVSDNVNMEHWLSLKIEFEWNGMFWGLSTKDVLIGYKNAREVEEVQPLELTLTEIAEKYGVSEVKIKQ